MGLISPLNFINIYNHRSVSVTTHMYYSECTYRISGFRVASGFYIHRTVYCLGEVRYWLLLYICWTANSTVYYRQV